MKKRLIVLIAAALLVGLAPTLGHARTPGFQYSAYGVHGGKGMIALGGKTFIFIPMFHFGYARGLSDSFNLTVDVDTLGVFTFADLGFKLRLMGSYGFSLGLKAELNMMVLALVVGGQGASGFGLGATPSLLMSFGGRSFQLTIQVGPRFSFLGAVAVGSSEGSGSASGTGFAWMLQPKIIVEFPVGKTTNLFIGITGLMIVDPLSIAPFLEVGASW